MWRFVAIKRWDLIGEFVGNWGSVRGFDTGRSSEICGVRREEEKDENKEEKTEE